MSTKAIREVLKRAPCTGSLGPCDHCDGLAEVEAIENAMKHLSSKGVGIASAWHGDAWIAGPEELEILDGIDALIESIAKEAP